jgi:AcrR family transcriptional regulator
MELSHEELRSRAVGLAHDLVVAEGVGGLTVRRIAHGLGCSVGTVYNLFEDLDDIVLHVAARVVDDLRASLFAPGLPSDPVTALVEIARRYIRFSSARPRLWALVFEWRSTNDRPSPRWHLARIAGLVDAVRVAAAPAFAGRADAGVIAASIEVLWASVHGIAVLAGRGKLGFVTSAEAEQLAERLIVTYMHGVGAPGGDRRG